MRSQSFINGHWVGGHERKIKNPYTGDSSSSVEEVNAQALEEALKAAASSFQNYKNVSRMTRSRLLLAIVDGLEERRQELVQSIVKESGKPVTAADGEVGRAKVTFTVAAEEAKRFGGEIVPVDIEPAGRAYSPAQSFWVPRGPVLAICPFNFPLNLVAHKVAPALAAGNSVVLKPAPQTPGASFILSQIFEKAAKAVSDSRDIVDLAAFQVVFADNALAEKMVTDPRLTVLSFTGSDKVGWMLQTKARGKKVILELGGNAAVIVDKDADLKRAAQRCAFGGFVYAGQVCISVQRIYVHHDVAAEFSKLFLEETKNLGVGDPQKPETTVGPLIDDRAMARLEEWIGEAKKSGAEIVTGGTKDHNVLLPTILTNVKPTLKISCEEAFGPVVVLDTFKDIKEAIQKVNDSKFGLQAGVFTNSLKSSQTAIQTLDVGGLIINDVPTFRADNMPYGGMKESGLGREGIRYTMEDYSERKTVVTWVG